MIRKIVFHAGNVVGQSDDSKAVQWDPSEQSQHDLMKDALAWAEDGNWPESDGCYAAAVWIEEDGEVLDSEDVRIGPDGEMEFPGTSHR